MGIGETQMTITQYQEQAARTINKQLSTKEISLHALHGLSAEVGEIHSLFQKAYQGHDMKSSALREELGDLAWFIAELCTSNGWSMENILSENIEKLLKRYPDGFDPDRSVHRGQT